MRDKECNILILESHKAAHLKNLKKEKAKEAGPGSQNLNLNDVNDRVLESEFSLLADSVAIIGSTDVVIGETDR